jgi:hypothetical protein
MNMKLRRSGNIWSAGAKSARRPSLLPWLHARPRLRGEDGSAISQSAAVGGALQKEEIMRLLREVTA